MNFIEKIDIQLEKKKQEIDDKYIGKRYLINYNDIIPSFNRLTEDNKDTVETTIIEYQGRGVYIDLLTQNIITDSSKFNTPKKADYMFDLYGINKYIKEIEIPQSEMFLNSISEEQKEKVKNIILKAKINALENLKKQLKSKENKVKSLQK